MLFQRFSLQFSTCWRLPEPLEEDINLFGRPQLSFSLRNQLINTISLRIL
jgi:hypothetical protein